MSEGSRVLDKLSKLRERGKRSERGEIVEKAEQRSESRADQRKPSRPGRGGPEGVAAEGSGSPAQPRELTEGRGCCGGEGVRAQENSPPQPGDLEEVRGRSRHRYRWRTPRTVSNCTCVRAHPTAPQGVLMASP